MHDHTVLQYLGKNQFIVSLDSETKRIAIQFIDPIYGIILAPSTARHLARVLVDYADALIKTEGN